MPRARHSKTGRHFAKEDSLNGKEQKNGVLSTFADTCVRIECKKGWRTTEDKRKGIFLEAYELMTLRSE